MNNHYYPFDRVTKGILLEAYFEAINSGILAATNVAIPTMWICLN